MKFYNIQAASQLSGVSAHCIRAWEKRYKAITPERSENGRRVYSEEELSRLLMLGKLSSMGNSISLIANLPNEALKQLLEKLGHKAQLGASSKKHIVEPQIYLGNMLLALQSYKLDILTHELNKASMDLSCRDFALEVIVGLFKRVGELVHLGKMSIAQEHTLSAITKFFIGKRIGQHYQEQQENSFKVALATPQGESHSIGLLLSALLMAEYGVNFIYLGEDLPAESIADAVKAIGANAVLLGVSPAYAYRTHGINEFSIELKKLLPKTELWVGGAVNQLRLLTIRDTQMTTFLTLTDLEEKITQLSNQRI